jgi:hypothetical protein
MKKTYIEYLLKKNPQITSGRKNYNKFEKRIEKNIFLTKIMIKSKNIREFLKKQSLKK